MATDSRGRFLPPKWCQVPTSARPQTLHAVVGESISGTALATLADKAVYTIGRADSGVDVRLRGELASRMHAAICQDAEGRKFLVDLRSTHGTFLGGKRLEPHVPVRWQYQVRASFGQGPNAESLALSADPAEGPGGDAANGTAAGGAPRSEAVAVAERGDAAVAAGTASPPAAKKQKVEAAEVDPMAALYGDLPEATVTNVAPRVEERKWVEPIPPPKEVTRVIFLDIDGVLRSVHGRTDFAKNVRTMLVNGQKVALMGDNTSANDNLAGIDFWPQAMSALRHIVKKTSCAVVLSSDWRKQEQLVDGVNNQLREKGIPKLHGQTPDLDPKNVAGVVKALHSNVREKRCKEIRKWLRKHGASIERWVAIDDMDLTAVRKDELRHAESGSQEPMPFLDSSCEFVKCNPAVGLTMELAKLVIAFLNGVEVTEQEMNAAYGQGPADTVSEADAAAMQALHASQLMG